MTIQILVTCDLPNTNTVHRTAFNEALAKTPGWLKLDELTTAWRVSFDSGTDQGIRQAIATDLSAAKRAARLTTVVYAMGVGGVVTRDTI